MVKDEPIQYSILDPTGNITALVESPVPVERQPSVAASLMERHPEVEQVGFVQLNGEGPVQARLRMAGGEFCGNAAMSAAALFLLRRGPQGEGAPPVLQVGVAGVVQPVAVRLRRDTEDSFFAGVHMPPAKSIGEKDFCFGAVRGKLPVVRMEGISHIIIEPASPFFSLREDQTAARQAVRLWCAALSADCLGLMFLERTAAECRLTPLVYVPGSGTVFWENSCASGSSAVGMALAAKTGTPVRLELTEPGGRLRVESDPEKGETWLWGRTRLLS